MHKIIISNLYNFVYNVPYTLLTFRQHLQAILSLLSFGWLLENSKGRIVP